MGTVDNNTPSHEDAVFGRRRALQSIFGTAAAVTIGAQASNALDMDAFMSSEVSLCTVLHSKRKSPSVLE